MSQLSSLTRFARTAVVALALGGAAMTAMPAQAAPYFPHMHMEPMRPMACMSDFQVRKMLQSRGYFNISFSSTSGRFIQARAVKGNWVYRVQVNRCSGAIVNVTRLRHR